MHVTLSQDIHATQVGRNCSGHIEVTVTVRNNDVPNLLNASGSLGFMLFDRAMRQIPDIHRVPPGGPDMGGPCQPGEQFDRTLEFNTGRIDPGQTYVLRCLHQVTGDYVDNTFRFQPTYLASNAPDANSGPATA